MKKKSGDNSLFGIMVCACLAGAYFYSMVTDSPVHIGQAAPAVTQNTVEEAVLSEVRLRQAGLYAYESLTEEEQRLYAEILAILEQRKEEITLSAIEEEVIGRVFQCVQNDHPELFYVEGYQLTKYTAGEEIRRITFSGTYAFTEEEIALRQEKIEQYVTDCLAGMPEGADEYEKVKYLYEYLILHTDYKLDAAENQTICSVFLYGESVCQGYAKAMQYLCRRAGIDSTLVVGTVENGEGHAWNLVQIDNAYYYADVTWGDAFYVFEPSGAAAPQDRQPRINYDYLCVTTEQLNKTHRIDNVVPMPRCVATDANYYVREGACFAEADIAKAEQLFAKAYEKSQETVTIKCVNEAVYAEMKQQLITEQQVFEFLKTEENTIAYTQNETQLTLSFWL